MPWGVFNLGRLDECWYIICAPLMYIFAYTCLECMNRQISWSCERYIIYLETFSVIQPRTDPSTLHHWEAPLERISVVMQAEQSIQCCTWSTWLSRLPIGTSSRLWFSALFFHCPVLQYSTVWSSDGKRSEGSVRASEGIILKYFLEDPVIF